MVNDFVTMHGGDVRYRYSIINGIVVDMPDTGAGVLSSLPNVKYVEKDGVVHALLDQSIPQIGADEVWSTGYDGYGVRVAVVDTGVDGSHPDLNGSKIVAWADFVYGQNATPYDDYGHGTHCAGIVAGSGAQSGGKYKGVAPGVSLMSAKVLDSTGSGTNMNVIKGIEWAVDNHAQVISLSLGSNIHSQALDDAINRAISRGVVVVVAAGNYEPGSSTITCPGDNPNAITVGAVYPNDTIAPFSLRGPSFGNIKPDIVAPGVGIISDRANGNPSIGYYIAMSGTSMATPMAAGTVALMLQKNRYLTPAQVKGILSLTAKPIEGGRPNNVYGWGRVCANYSVNNTTLSSLQFNLSSYYVNESAGTVTLNVTRTGYNILPVKISYTTTNGTALAGINYQASSGILTFQPADAYKTFTVNIIDDGIQDAQKYFTVSLSSPDNATLASPAASQIFINDQSIIADFVSNVTSGQSPLVVQFNDTSVGDGLNGWRWNFGDGTGNFTAQNVTHIFTNAGPDTRAFTVTLTINNATSRSTKQKVNYIVIDPQPPLANFSSNVTSGTSPLAVQFNDTSMGYPGSWQWNFGDGTENATIKNPVHTYDHVGNYTVLLTVFNAGGNSSVKKIDYINVTEPLQISFNVSLVQGWNMISIPVQLEDTNITRHLSAYARDHIYVIWMYNGSGVWKYWTEIPGYTSTLTDFDIRHGYQIYTDVPLTIEVTGTLPNSDEVQVNNGDWNIIGHPGLNSIDPASRYSEAYVVWALKNGSWYFYTPIPGYTSTLSSLDPGYGYEVYI